MSPPRGRSPQSLDDLDRKIVEQLQQDGRRTFGRIATAVGSSEATVRQRVQRLQEADVMRIVAVVDPTSLGFELRATLTIRADGVLNDVAEAIAELPEVDYAVVTAGAFDVLVEVLAENIVHFHSVLDQVRRVDGVRAVETLMYLRVVKQTYPWPPA
jgi:Lrp/AsnC family transcriptional regulator for asnA, asnC and gidA